MSSPPPFEQMDVEVVDSEPMEEEEDDSTDIGPDQNDGVSRTISERFSLPQNADATVELWRTKMSEGVLAATHFQDYWRVTVPRLYSPQLNRNCLDWSWDEELAEKLLIRPLEQFIWGSDGPDVVKKAPAKRATICGRVFKHGEPAYSCRECGMDNTCVLCVECFKVSAHRNHKYKMGQSNGGGCCDCGDTEAWKSEPYCQIHQVSEQNNQESSGLPEDVVQRMKIVASVTLSYCFQLLTLDHAPGLPNELRLKDAERDPLQILDQPDCYCTVLYNDETHTFDQVITTLVRVLNCSHRDAVELVSHIDREGRALVKCNSFSVCDKLMGDIERFTSRHGPSLKVLVMHAHVVAHQVYAMRLLQWLQGMVNHDECLRLAVSWIALGEEEVVGGCSVTGGGGVAQGVMQNDYKLWKEARTAWHRLLITTMLMDYNTKKALAILFTKNYATILKDYIRDDHDHSFSISSLSVQLYTTPTLAHRLIAHHDALFVLLHTFLSECSRRTNAKGRLEFERNNQTKAFKRAQVILYDIKYLLSSVPTEWTDDLRRGFLHGLTLMLNLLAMMQGMDSVSRQVGQHMEFEPEWESAFNLHIKLAHGISLALAWCRADRTLAAKAYRLALKKLHETETFDEPCIKELGGHSARVIPYNVASQPVSIHLPLSRFVAGLHLLLHQHGLSYHGAEFQIPKPTPEQLVEPVLRTSAMVGQVHANMWRRNGYALLNQIYFYHNVKCRSEMLDRDILMMQIGASLIESNEFMVHLIYKFGLLAWADPKFEEKNQAIPEDDPMRHTICLVEEFLGLLISIVGSRYVPGVGEVTQEDRTKKEIIQALCVKSMPHSELNKALPEDELHETGLEAVINEVANFTKPTGANTRGLYTLKPELYEEYDTFFYHYSREDLSKSEEAQRNRRKAAGLPECCPPPSLPKLTEPFRLLAGLLQCSASMYFMKTVLERADDLRARSFSETQVHKVLHLIGYGLRDEESGHYEFVSFAAALQRAGIVPLLQSLATSARVDAHRPLIVWTLNKLRSMLGDQHEEKASETMATEQENPSSSESAERKELRAKRAAERRANLMAQMKAAQNNFITNNATLFNETDSERLDETEQDPFKRTDGPALGIRNSSVQPPPRTCIMCQEEALIDAAEEPLVLVAFIQYSTVYNRNRSGYSGLLPDVDSRAWLPSGLGPAPHVSSCGHALHWNCWQKYIENVALKENRRPYRLRQPAPFDIEKREYLCPLCERLCNSALPLLPLPQMTEVPPLSEAAFHEGINVVLGNRVMWEIVNECSESCAELHCVAKAAVHVCTETCEHQAGADLSQEIGGAGEGGLMCTVSKEMLPSEFLRHFSNPPTPYLDVMKTLTKQFANYFKVAHQLTDKVSGVPALIYRSLSYTIHSTDMVLMAENRPLLGALPARHSDALQALIRLTAAFPSVWPKPEYLAHHALDSIYALLKRSPLSYDAFGALVPAVLAAPCLLGEAAPPANPGTLTLQLTLLAFRSCITKAMMCLDFSNCKTDEAMEDYEYYNRSEDLSGVLELLGMIRASSLDVAHLSQEKVWHEVKEECVPFLRRVCLLAYFLNDVPAPKELLEVGEENWNVMCRYLGLPATFKELMCTEWARKLVNDWVSKPETASLYKGEIDMAIVREARFPPTLIALPEDYSELINLVSTFTCPNSEHEDSKYPTMCLVCGEMLCSQSYCCQIELNKTTVGACVGHCVNCGGGSGLFIRVRDCELLLLAAPARGASLPAPYLDCYGETDQGLRRGNPLKLCSTRYEEIRLLWLSHGLHEKIARSLDGTSLLPPLWQHM